MPAYRFAWSNFDEKATTSLARAEAYNPAAHGGDPLKYLQSAVPRPDEEFVRRHKDLLADVWLRGYPGTRHLVERLIDEGIGPMGAPRSTGGYVEYVNKTRNCSTLRSLILEALHRFGDTDKKDSGDESSYQAVQGTRRFVVLRPTLQPRDTRQAYPFQEEAWQKLNAHLAEGTVKGVFQGLLVMPTGAGKTYTTVSWLMSQVVNRGGRVLWLAHRHELLEQAAREFHHLASLAPAVDQLRVRIVSGEHCAARQIDDADHVLICSTQSLYRHTEIVERLAADPARMIVVDEAHHAPATTYREILGRFIDRSRHKVLGITATPTRTIEREQPVLSRLFGGRVIHEVAIKRLIEQKFLARPIPVRVETRSDVERGLTKKDEEYFAQFNDFSEDMLDRIAHLADRNRLIVNEYLEHDYGKTLIFAINVVHAAMLTEALIKAGVNAKYVASYRPDDSEGEVLPIIREFREGKIDVLVNVKILTEGVDLPKVQTVFLTKPTTSEILMRQMVGRALRGPKANGTETAYLVSFQDHWDRFREWQDQLALVPDIIGPLQTPEPVQIASNRDPLADLPWEVIRKMVAGIPLGREHDADRFEAVPHGWYVLERIADGVAVRQVVAVYEHQKDAWEALMAHVTSLDAEALARIESEREVDEFFDDVDAPLPALHDVRAVVAHVQAGGPRPAYEPIKARLFCDPYEVAALIRSDNPRETERSKLIEERYSSLARAIYPTLREYRGAIEDALFELEHPNESTRRRRGVPIFEPRPDNDLKPGPHHNLQQLFDEVLGMGREITGQADPLPFVGKATWTRRRIKGWYGMADWTEDQPHGHGRIRINCLLNSADIPVAAMRFLLWHEYLHVWLKQNHTTTFYQYEHKWPGWADADAVFASLNEKFGIQYW